MARAPKPRSSTLMARRRAMGGLKFFRRMLAGEMPQAPLTAMLNMRLLEVEEGRVVFGATPTRAVYNGMGVAHGGFAATMLDSALGCAINTMAPPGKVFTTLELKINYTRPLTEDVGPVRCEARVLHVGSRTATAEGRLIDRHGKLYAHGTTTCIVVEPTRPARGK